MRRILWSRGSRRDLQGAREYWRGRDPTLIEQLLEEAERQAAFLAEHPGAGSPTPFPGLRKWKIGRTPYLMLCRADAGAIRVLRVYHERQNWRGA